MKNPQKQNYRMKYFSATLLLLITIGLTANAQDEAKRYHVKSAKITYKTNSPSGKGTKVLFFDQYGMRESKHETLQKNGKTMKDQLVIINDGKTYIINLLKHTGTVADISGSMQMMQMGGKDMSATGMKMLESMGGKMTGHQQFLGKNCEKWAINTMGKTTMLLWQGIPLKTETSVMGITTSEEAVSIQAGQTFADADFAPPVDVKINQPEGMGMGGGMGSQMSAEDKAHMKKMMNMSFADFKKMVKKEDPNASDEEIRQTYDMMKKMGKFLK